MATPPETLESPLSETRREMIQKARDKAFILYEGRLTPHRSCGIALAETFGLPTPPYQALRRGGITGEGECGSIKAGELILGQLFGDPDPVGMVTPTLRSAMVMYRQLWQARVDRGGNPSIVCNHLTSPHGDFMGAGRKAFCTTLAAQVAEVVAEVVVRHGVDLDITPIPGVEPKPQSDTGP